VILFRPLERPTLQIMANETLLPKIRVHTLPFPFGRD
jgi:hypothetical protein